MTDRSKFRSFRFINFDFSDQTGIAKFTYAFDDDWQFEETVTFSKPSQPYCGEALQRALFCCFITLGTSYYKLFPGAEMVVERGSLTQDQADFFTQLYRGGLSQFVYENALEETDIKQFRATADESSLVVASPLDGRGILLLQSGGKDSLLAAELLKQNDQAFDAWHMSSTGHHPEVIDQIGAEDVVAVTRKIDLATITAARAAGGLNGHVPFSAITAGLALVQAVISRKRYVIAAMEASADEPNTRLGDYAVNHAYSKSYEFELALQDYIFANIAQDLDYVSIIRPFTDLRVAELFTIYAWEYANQFSSCNIANYKQGQDAAELSWCGQCSKCANSYLLFVPFVNYDELVGLFGGKNLLADSKLKDYFLALLGIEGIKPFECVGTVDELRAAYHLAIVKDGRNKLDIEVPKPVNNYQTIHPSQKIVKQFIDWQL